MQDVLCKEPQSAHVPSSLCTITLRPVNWCKHCAMPSRQSAREPSHKLDLLAVIVCTNSSMERFCALNFSPSSDKATRWQAAVAFVLPSRWYDVSCNCSARWIMFTRAACTLPNSSLYKLPSLFLSGSGLLLPPPVLAAPQAVSSSSNFMFLVQRRSDG